MIFHRATGRALVLRKRADHENKDTQVLSTELVKKNNDELKIVQSAGPRFIKNGECKRRATTESKVSYGYLICKAPFISHRPSCLFSEVG